MGLRGGGGGNMKRSQPGLFNLRRPMGAESSCYQIPASERWTSSATGASLRLHCLAVAQETT